jgi:hypothetical protein
MYSTLLFLHFLGVSIGAGTGIYMLALRRHSATNLDQAEARTLMPGVAGAISRVGNLGLLTLIISGSGMGLMLGDSVLSPMFTIKMLLVVLIIIFVVVMHRLAALAQRGADTSAAQLMHAQLMKKLGIAGPVLGVLTILAAVAAFH